MLTCLARRPRSHPAILARLPWPGADPASGPSLYLDQLSLWDAALDGQTFGSKPDQPRFRAAGCTVRRIPPRGSEGIIGEFLARHHYTSGAGMRGLALGLYRDSTLLGTATFSRVARPRWAAENFVLLPSDRRRNPEQRRHLTVTEAEYAALTRFALAPQDIDGRALGNGAASWFLCRCLAGLEARNRLLWTAQQRDMRGLPLSPEHIRLLREGSGVDQGRGRGYLKAVVTWADPYEGMLGHIYQVLNFHYAGRTNGGGWNREAIGRRSGRRLSTRTLANARRPGTAGHMLAALRIAWEGGQVRIEADGRVHTDLSCPERHARRTRLGARDFGCAPFVLERMEAPARRSRGGGTLPLGRPLRHHRAAVPAQAHLPRRAGLLRVVPASHGDALPGADAAPAGGGDDGAQRPVRGE